MKTKTLLLLLITITSLSSYSQSPGGVSTNLTMWVHSQSGTSTTGTSVDSWTYLNDGTKSFTSAGAARPQLFPSGLNLRPVLRLDGTRIMTGPNGVNAPIAALDDDYTIFSVWQSNTVTAFQRVWTQLDVGAGGADGASLCTWNDGRYGDEVEVGPFDHTTVRPYTVNHWNISQLNLLNQPTNDLEIIDDRNFSTSPTLANTDGSGVNGPAVRQLGANNNTVGSKLTAGEQALNGDIAEIIVYDRPISGAERTRIFSYLSVKYGIHLGTNLVKSDGATVWDATTNSTYNNAVFGLGRDDASGLNMSTSHSTTHGQGNSISKPGDVSVRLFNPTALSDQDFLVVGDDNGAVTETTANVPLMAAGSQRLVRQWRVQHTGNVGTVEALIDISAISVTGTAASDFRIVVDEDGDGNFTTGTFRVYNCTAYGGPVVMFTNVALNTGEVFMLVTKAQGGLVPVTWKSFSAKAVGNNAQLKWEVANNDQAKEYQLEYSSDGVNFSQFAIVPNQLGVTSYSYTYRSLTPGRHYFRIKQVDFDGRYTYSAIASVKGSDIAIQLLDNPTRKDYVEIDVYSVRPGKALVELNSITGASLGNRQTFTLSAGTTRIRIPLEKATGVYILKLQSGDVILTERILKQ